MRQNLRSFTVVENADDKGQLPLWELSRVIRELRDSGSNVERLQTIWHSRWSYAFSICVLGIMAMALLTFTENPYTLVGLSLIVVFLHYGLHTMGASAGNAGILPPVVAAWFANGVFALLAGARLAWVYDTGLREKVFSLLPSGQP